jgi:hypothetical protein
MDSVTAERDAGDIPSEQIADVVYRDLVADPLGTVERLYAGWELPISEEFRATLESYLAAHHSGRAGGHEYSFADTGLDLSTHRALLRPYQERFGVPSEV